MGLAWPTAAPSPKTARARGNPGSTRGACGGGYPCARGFLVPEFALARVAVDTGAGASGMARVEREGGQQRGCPMQRGAAAEQDRGIRGA
eukprot:6105846-Alexandrium_andersonii.AAC.1